MTSERIEDPLKSLNTIHEPDERQAYFVYELEDMHDALSEIVLKESVPANVRQLFETAKNLSLYSWFVYRFHQVAELVGFSALEMALRERYLEENPDSEPPMLDRLMRHAKKQGWITNDGFANRREIARHRVEMKKSFEIIDSGVLETQNPVRLEDPTDEEVEQELKSLDIVNGVVESAAKLRNSLAHGSSTLGPTSISTLNMTAEIINQIFK